MFVEVGSILQLECVVSQVVSPPKFIMWQHQERVVPGVTNYVTAKHDVISRSVLKVGVVRTENVGRYFCLPDNFSPATIDIRIVNKTHEQLALSNRSVNVKIDLVILLLLIIMFFFSQIRSSQSIVVC